MRQYIHEIDWMCTIMNEFEIELPTENSIRVDFTDKTYYNYDFQSISLAPLQQTAGLVVANYIKKELFSHVSKASLIEKLANKNEIEYVANLSVYAKEKLKSGEWVLGIRKKTGETYAVIKEVATGKNKSFVTLDARTVQKLGNLPELSAIQGQLAAITEQIQDLNKLVARVEQGQYNDRYAGFFSARQLVVEGLVANNESLRRELLISAVKTNNDTIAKLMFSIYQDAYDFIDLKTKPKEAKRIDNLLQNAIGYLNSAVQLNLVAYTAMGEDQSLLATLTNYQSFVEQTLLKEIGNSGKTVSWKIDNAHSGPNGKFSEISNDISMKITKLVESAKDTEIGDEEYERIETEVM